MTYELKRRSIDTIIKACNNLKANDELKVKEFGENKDLTLHIIKDGDFD